MSGPIWELVVHDRAQRRQYALSGERSLLIGRSAECDLRIDDDSVSRQHARVYPSCLEIEDLSSRNGSWWLQGKPGAAPDALADCIARDGKRLEPGARQRFGEGSLLKLGNVLCYLQRSAPLTHTVPVPAAPAPASDLILEDRAMVQLYDLAARSAATTLPVLILGETGVGKDVLAAHVHRSSARSDGPFVRVNCGALSESLLESELFGHQRGAFTGANDAKAGLLELGHGGSVFLDEIGELPLRTQVKLLHVLETGEVTRVGGTKAQRIDVRFIAATNRVLAREVQLGRFRKDLYFRINALCLKIAPLRSRPDDIVPLVRYFLRRFCSQVGLPEPLLSGDALRHLETYAWPGNIRELKNAVERAPILCGHGALLPHHFPMEPDLSSSSQLQAAKPVPLPEETPRFTDAEPPTRTNLLIPQAPPAATASHDTIAEALRNCGGNQTRAAAALGISRRTLINRLNEYNLPRPRKAGG